MEQEQKDKLYWVYGNTQPLLIPLEKEVITPQEPIVYEPYYPDADAVVTVNLVGRFRKYSYTPVVNGNLLTIADDGTLPVGCYGVEILIDNPDGTHERSEWNCQIVVTNDNWRTLKEWDEFKEQDIKARAAIFFFAKGDPFTYEDFTPEEIEGLKKPAYDAAAEVAVLEKNIEDAEALRVQAEQGRVQAEGGRVQAEEGRVSAEQDREDAEQGREDAENLRVAAEEDRAETFSGYEEDMSTMEGDIADMKDIVDKCEDDVADMKAAMPTKLDEITQEQFNAIFI